MPRRRREPFLDRAGRRLRKLPAGQLFGLGLLGHLIFAGVSLLVISRVFFGLAESVKPRISPPLRIVERKDAGFDELLTQATGIAYSAFFDLSLSQVNFVSNYLAPMEIKDRRWNYTFWELWVPNDFDFEAAQTHFAKKLSGLGDGVRLDSEVLDAKTFRINIRIHGLVTHSVFLTRAGLETEEDSRPVFVLDDVREKIPSRRYHGPPRVAVIIDDIGYRDILEARFLDLDAALTFSILPFTPYGNTFALRALGKGREIMLHMPMEPKNSSIRPGKGGLFVRMPNREIRKIMGAILDEIAGIKGVNNHMGSLFTSNSKKMAVVLKLVRKRKLYFIDSRTAASSQGYEVAKYLGLHTAVRNVFLDHNPAYESVLSQLDILAAIAKRQGTAIAIGHPNENTLRALKTKLPIFREMGVEIVPPSEIIP